MSDKCFDYFVKRERESVCVCVHVMVVQPADKENQVRQK